MVGIILLPLRDSRREKFDYMENTIKLMKHFKTMQPKDHFQKLYFYTNRKTKCIDMEKNGREVVKLLHEEPFFKRFNEEVLYEMLAGGSPEYFKRNEVIFINDRVGIITHGSVRVKSHDDEMLNPTVLCKYGKGKILGHLSDNGVTTHAQSWIISYDDCTEILFFTREEFEKLWRI